MTTATLGRRSIAIGKGAIVIAATIAFMIGFPWALVTFVGNPFPTVIPSLEEIRVAITRGQVDDWTIIKGVALVAWAAWAHLALSLGVEIAAAIKGGTAAAVRGLGATQWLAAKIVSQVSLVITLVFQSTIGVAGAAAVPLPTSDAAFATAAPIQNATAHSNTTGFDTTLDASPSQALTTNDAAVIDVARSDTLWGLAETHLGSGEQWETIRDANVGRVMPDGTKLPAGFTQLSAGWTLEIPGLTATPDTDETDIDPNETLEVGVDSATGEWIIGSWAVEPGDHFWRISEEVLETAWGRQATDAEISEYWTLVVDANRQHLISPGDNPNLIYPDQQFEVLLPPLPAEITSPSDAAATTTPFEITGLDQFTPSGPVAPTTTPVPATPQPEPESVPEPVEQSAPVQAAVPDVVMEEAAPVEIETAPVAATGGPSASGLDVRTIGLGIFGTAVGAGLLMMVLRKRRQFQAARRRPGTEIEPMPVMPSEFEERIRPIGDQQAARWLQATNRFLSHRLSQHPESKMPAVVAMRAGKYGVELVLDEPCVPVEGFVNGGLDGQIWRLHPDLEPRMLEAEAGHAHPFAPGLLPVGGTEEGDLLLDLEQIGVLAVLTDDDEFAVGWLRSLAVGVTSVPWSQQCEVIAIGLGDEIGAIPQVTVPDDPAEWARAAATRHRATAKRLTASSYEQRVNPGELHFPELVLVGPSEPGVGQFLAEVAELAFAPLAVIAAGTLSDAVRVEIQGPNLATVEPYGLDFVPATTELDAIKLAVSALQATSDAVSAPRPSDFADPIVAGDEPTTKTTEVSADDGAVLVAAQLASTLADEPDDALAAFLATEAEGDDVDDTGPAALETEKADNDDDDDDPTDPPNGPSGGGAPTPDAEDAATTPSDQSDTDGSATETVALPEPVASTATADVEASVAEVLTARPIEIKVLTATPTIQGLDTELRAKIAAVVAFLGFSRAATADRIREVFWPSSVSRGTADNAITEIRRVLGTNESGESRLPTAVNTGRLELDDEVGCDWSRVQALVSLAKKHTSSPTEEMMCLRAALELVDGRPGADTSGKNYLWLTDDHQTYTMVETVIADAAYRLGQLANTAGEYDTARWAADKGLMVVPGQEALHRIQMQAAAESGDEEGVEAAFRAAGRAAESLSAWEDVQPETDALYALLTGRTTARAEAQRAAGD